MPAGLPRVVDVGLAGAALVALSPMLLTLIILVIASSPGGALYAQIRIGLNGRPFTLLKLRSMRPLSSGTAEFAPGDTERVTPIGRFMRRYKLDELPQLLNVMRGDMALVGPRPEVPSWVARYTLEQRAALAVRPGLTGPSQLAYRHEEQLLLMSKDPERTYAEVVLPAKLALDLAYVCSRSPLGDARLIARTVGVLLGAA